MQTSDKRPGPTEGIGRWGVVQKLTTASVLMILLTLITGGVGFWQVFVLRRAVTAAHGAEQRRAWSLEMLAAGQGLVGALDRMILTEDARLASTEVPVSLGALDYSVEALQGAGGGAEGSELLRDMQAAYDALRRAEREIDTLARQELWSEAGAVMEQEVRPANERMGSLIRRLVRQTDREAEEMASRVQMMVQRAVVLMIILVAVTAAVALGWRRWVFRGMWRSIAELRQGVARIGGGDLEYALDIRTGDEIEELGNEFNRMAGRLAELIGSLERRVAERTRELERRAVHLETAAKVARDAAVIREVDQLLDETVRLISDQFGFYHAAIFLADEAGDYAVLRAASSEGGQRMLARRHRLQIGREGIVGYVTGRGEPRVALDVGEDAVFFDNPDLPDTRSEMALPLRARGEVIGALDVQSTEPKAFGEQDLAVLQIMADQVAVAISNARLFRQAQEALEAERRAYGEMSREAWRDLLRERPTMGFVKERGVISPAEGDWQPAMESALRTGETASGEAGRGNVAVPIRIRGQVLGVIDAYKPEGDDAWTPEQLELLETLVDQLEVALESARLYESTQRRAARERLATEIAGQVRASLDPDTILKTTVRELGRALRAEFASVEVGGSAGGEGGIPSDGPARGEEES